MKWSYGVTTVPSRFQTTLPRTLCSLSAGGFASPRLFIDGVDRPPVYLAKYDTTCHQPLVRTWMNWSLGIYELYGRDPDADRFAMFQDDVICVAGLRAYLESVEMPAKGYWNLYTADENVRDQAGFYRSNQKGLGALALVFDNEGLRRLLRSPHFVNRPHPQFLKPDVHVSRTWKAIDGGIVDSMRKAGYREYVHNPSLVQHIGVESSMGNGRWPESGASSFPGVRFDARQLITDAAGGVAGSGDTGLDRGQSERAGPRPHTDAEIRVAVPSGGRSIGGFAGDESPRLGLVGYNAATGLGTLNRQIATHLPIAAWLVKPHRNLATLEDFSGVDATVHHSGERPIRDWLESVDRVIFCETPYYKSLTRLCREMGKPMFCVPMQEWLPLGQGGWIHDVDLFICPTRHCFDEFKTRLPCVLFPWPVDVERFPFVERQVCERFLFVNGHGGWNGRKGADVIRAALELWPDMPLAVRSQTDEVWPAGVAVLPAVEDQVELYSVGDVLLVPHKVDGVGLEPMEAAACGMPSIVTSGRPWDELPAVAMIAATKTRRKVNRVVDWHEPSPASLVEVCRGLVGKPLAEQSRAVLKWAKLREWAARRDQLWELLSDVSVAGERR